MFQLELLTDAYGEDISWTLLNDCDSIEVATTGDVEHEDGTYHLAEACVPADKQYTFTILDSYGDGLCCKPYQHGFYRVFLDGIFVQAGGDFQYGESVTMGSCKHSKSERSASEKDTGTRMLQKIRRGPRTPNQLLR